MFNSIVRMALIWAFYRYRKPIGIQSRRIAKRIYRSDVVQTVGPVVAKQFGSLLKAIWAMAIGLVLGAVAGITLSLTGYQDYVFYAYVVPIIAGFGYGLSRFLIGQGLLELAVFGLLAAQHGLNGAISLLPRFIGRELYGVVDAAIRPALVAAKKLSNLVWTGILGALVFVLFTYVFKVIDHPKQFGVVVVCGYAIVAYLIRFSPETQWFRRCSLGMIVITLVSSVAISMWPPMDRHDCIVQWHNYGQPANKADRKVCEEVVETQLMTALVAFNKLKFTPLDDEKKRQYDAYEAAIKAAEEGKSAPVVIAAAPVVKMAQDPNSTSTKTGTGTGTKTGTKTTKTGNKPSAPASNLAILGQAAQAMKDAMNGKSAGQTAKP